MKLLNTFLFGLILILCHSNSIDGFLGLPRPEHYIVNGTNTTIEEIPFQISLRRSGAHTCGGSILTETIVLTAAHCLHPLSLEQMLVIFSVRVGHTDRNSGAEYRLSNAIYHADFTDRTYQYDVGLLKLAEPLTFGPTVQPVVLIGPNFVLPYGNIGVVSGWGRLWHGGPLPDILQSADVEIVETARCAANYLARGYLITHDMFCAGSFYGKVDNCHGDSGGPLVYDGAQIGVVSWGLDCAQVDFPGVYASVSVLRDWIDQYQATL